MNPLINGLTIAMLMFFFIMSMAWYRAWTDTSPDGYGFEINFPRDADETYTAWTLRRIFQVYMRIIWHASPTQIFVVMLTYPVLCLFFLEEQRWRGWEVNYTKPLDWLPLEIPEWTAGARVYTGPSRPGSPRLRRTSTHRRGRSGGPGDSIDHAPPLHAVPLAYDASEISSDRGDPAPEQHVAFAQQSAGELAVRPPRGRKYRFFFRDIIIPEVHYWQMRALRAERVAPDPADRGSAWNMRLRSSSVPQDNDADVVWAYKTGQAAQAAGRGREEVHEQGGRGEVEEEVRREKKMQRQQQQQAADGRSSRGDRDRDPYRAGVRRRSSYVE